ncbi:MAG: methyltransferase domain-containing protein [Deltaproteobacteria bacterium]|nr:methyltransferase domain-containing protein [Deltaproteobacteria bacterium]
MTVKQRKTATWSKFSNVDKEANPEEFVNHMNDVAGMEGVKSYKQETFSLLEVRDGAAILDLGSGPGNDARSLAEIVGPKGRVVGVDKSETMVASAQKQTKDLGFPLEFQVGDILNLKFEDNTFDGCRADRVFHHLEKPEAALSELTRVARPGARIVLAEPDFDGILIDASDKTVTRQVIQKRSDLYPCGWCGRQLPRLFKKAGLTDLIVIPKTLIFDDFDIVDQEIFGFRNAAEKLLNEGELSQKQVDDWLTELEQASQDGLFFCMATLFIVSAKKAM